MRRGGSTGPVPLGCCERGTSKTVARARLVGDRLQDVKIIFSQKPKIASRNRTSLRQPEARRNVTFTRHAPVIGCHPSLTASTP